jgi:hypothetical protein
MVQKSWCSPFKGVFSIIMIKKSLVTQNNLIILVHEQDPGFFLVSVPSWVNNFHCYFFKGHIYLVSENV